MTTTRIEVRCSFQDKVMSNPRVYTFDNDTYLVSGRTTFL
jgi:hypothetical protein